MSLVWSWRLSAVDDQDLDGAFRRFKLEPELFPDRGEEVRRVWISRRWNCSNHGSANAPRLRAGTNALRLRGVRRDQVHERRRQAIVGFEAEFLQPSPDCSHVIGIRTGLYNR